jgi:hypothetical protein
VKVWPLETRVAAGEGASADAAAGQRPAFEKHVLHPGEKLADRAVGDIVERDRLCAAEGEADVEMVLQIAADPGHVA